MKTRKIRIAGRNFGLLFNYAALAELTDAIEGFDVGQILTYARSPKFFPVLVAAMARAGETAQGREPDVDAAWFSNHMRPSVNSVIRIQTAVTEALTDGMTMETEEEEDGEVDVTLEEIKKKDDPEA